MSVSTVCHVIIGWQIVAADISSSQRNLYFIVIIIIIIIIIVVSHF